MIKPLVWLKPKWSVLCSVVRQPGSGVDLICGYNNHVFSDIQLRVMCVCALLVCAGPSTPSRDGSVGELVYLHQEDKPAAVSPPAFDGDRRFPQRTTTELASE